MNTLVDRNASYKLRAHWKSKWQDTHDEPFRGNVHREAAQLLRIADDIGVDETKKLIDFYFEVRQDPEFVWFVYNYDKLQTEWERREEDRAHRAKLREATRKRMQELEDKEQD